MYMYIYYIRLSYIVPHPHWFQQRNRLLCKHIQAQLHFLPPHLVRSLDCCYYHWHHCYLALHRYLVTDACDEKTPLQNPYLHIHTHVHVHVVYVEGTCMYTVYIHVHRKM